MSARMLWNFAIDESGHARLARASATAAVETVEPGEYLVTLPIVVAREFGIEANVDGDAGFISATPGDEAGNKTNVLRVLTVGPDNMFAPRPFTLVVRTA
jgi:hypothetical protein